MPSLKLLQSCSSALMLTYSMRPSSCRRARISALSVGSFVGSLTLSALDRVMVSCPSSVTMRSAPLWYTRTTRESPPGAKESSTLSSRFSVKVMV